MPIIYDYFDYRSYLKDFYKEKKAGQSSFSYQIIANKAGFKSKSFFPQVVDGKRNLSEESVFALGNFFKLSEKEFKYFKSLVDFNQARTHAQKEHFFKALLDLNVNVKSKVILRDKHQFYSKWYHNTIRELVTFVDFKEDYSLLARMVKPRITTLQAKQSVEMLLRLGFINKKGNSYIQADPDISTGDSVVSFSVEQFHIQNLQIAAESVRKTNSSERDISCIIAGLNDEGAQRVKEELRTFRKKLIAIINHYKDPKRVYHVNFQFFPTTEHTDEKGRQ